MLHLIKVVTGASILLASVVLEDFASRLLGYEDEFTYRSKTSI